MPPKQEVTFCILLSPGFLVSHPCDPSMRVDREAVGARDNCARIATTVTFGESVVAAASSFAGHGDEYTRVPSSFANRQKKD